MLTLVTFPKELTTEKNLLVLISFSPLFVIGLTVQSSLTCPLVDKQARRLYLQNSFTKKVHRFTY